MDGEISPAGQGDIAGRSLPRGSGTRMRRGRRLGGIGLGRQHETSMRRLTEGCLANPASRSLYASLANHRLGRYYR